MGRGLRRDEVGLELGGRVVREGATNDLLYDAAVDINAAAKFGHYFSFSRVYVGGVLRFGGVVEPHVITGIGLLDMVSQPHRLLGQNIRNITYDWELKDDIQFILNKEFTF